MYVVDRMQMVTKFVVMCYIASAAIPLLEALIDAAAPGSGVASEASGAGSPALLQLARTTVQLLQRLPGVSAATPPPSEDGEGLAGAMAGLDAERREVLQEAVGGIGSSLAAKLDERLMALRG